ncbi:hypothetical protein [Actinomadura sp. 3N508]|uniref:hypothetical protein n=1 Tax=Actinomadura sp. 3N508 TaxID=3375153 RepID=UPI0037AED5FA
MNQQPIADARSTLKFLLDGSGRKSRSAPIRTTFVGIPLKERENKGPRTKPGPLSVLVKRHDATGLDLYLILMALASALPYDVTRDSRYFARALDLKDAKDNYNTGAISKAWARLEDRGLITRARKGKLASITPRPESGEAPEDEPYTAPAGKDDWYFKIPFEYWLDDEQSLHEKLTLPEKAMLLIGLSRLVGKTEFTLTAENAERWYGVSTETAQRGLKGLVDKKVFERRRARRAAPETPEGFTYDSFYSLTGPLKKQAETVTDDTPAEAAPSSATPGGNS